MTKDRFPPGWDEERVRRVLDHYEQQTDEEAVAEDEDRLDASTRTVLEVPSEFLPAIRKVIAKGSVQELTARELEILELISQGLNNREIAEKLVMSEKTVRDQVSKIFTKLHERAEVVPAREE